ncbi:acyltransferase family protein [uncultured Massilia sp.]|uniref:acyltransferase family protein n=1 Tax=uncultured Massilia sp. TaxID=169973 RepID=UPI0025D6B420|nr:acyltransferase family protein [uncultured Massilia sp.]
MKRDAHAALGMPDALGYRPDIDGMRALAVLAVIVFHIDKDLLPGGFAGVDVFFVISGYLISAHIFRAGREGTFSFVDFYFRRIRRIAPAMAVVVFATLAVAQFMLLPEDARAAAKSAVWSFASMANVYFWLFQDTGYFAASSSELPLLHLWSLGVEEQFYLVWPVVALALCRWRLAALAGAIALVAAASFALGQAAFAHSPGFAYYMLPSRCGELLLGALAAAVVVAGTPGQLRTVARCAAPLAASGLALVLASIALLSERLVFPGWWAVPPTAGAALLILGGANGTSVVSRLLGTPVLRRIGAISYSAYLWHWPLLAFYRYGYGEPGLAAGTAIFCATLALAELTYRFVEQPARRGNRIGWRAGFVGWAAGSVVLAGVSLAFVYPERFLPAGSAAYARSLAALRALDLPTTAFDYVCQRKVLAPGELDNPRCALGKGSLPAARILLMGDSNAAHYVGIVATFAEHGAFRFRNLEVGSCPPVFGDVARFADARRIADCTASQRVWRAAIAAADVIILGGSWSEYQRNSPQFLPTLFAQVDGYVAAGKRVILLGKVPVITQYDRLCREKALRFPFKDCAAGTNPMLDEIVRVNASLRRYAQGQAGVAYFDVETLLCPGGICSAYGPDRASLYFDKHHLSMKGSWDVGRRLYAAAGIPPAFRLALDETGGRE